MTTALAITPPTKVTTKQECDVAVEFLRTVALFRKAVTEAHENSVKLAHQSHKAAIKTRDDLIAPLLGPEAEVRTMVEVYAESNELPEGVFARDVYRVTVTDRAKLPDWALMPDMKAIQDWAKRTDGQKLDGVEILKETGITVRELENGK